MREKYVKVGKRVYSNVSVVHLMELHKEISQDPEEIIRHLARNEIADARNYGLNGPPFDPRILASIVGIQCEELKQLIRSEDAELHPIGKRNTDLIIRYNPINLRHGKTSQLPMRSLTLFFQNMETSTRLTTKLVNSILIVR